MHIRHIPSIPWLPLLALVLAGSALADDGPAAQQQIVAELRDVAAFERRVERALEEDVERAMSAVMALEFERQAEHRARRYRFGPRNSVPASPAPRQPAPTRDVLRSAEPLGRLGPDAEIQASTDARLSRSRLPGILQFRGTGSDRA